MDKIKQVGVIILLIAVIFSFAPIEGRQTYAAGHAGNTGQCKWEYDQNTNSLHIYGNGDMGNYDENNTAPWCPSDPINGDEDLVVKAVVIDDGVTNVGSFAFYGCVELASITMPDSITKISAGSLMYCESLRSVKIPDKVASIGDHSFFECEELTSIDIPDSVGSIGKDAFAGCKSLVNVKLGKGLEEIRSGAFYDTGLHSIRVPQSVDWIDYHAFGYIDDDDDEKKVSDFEMVVASGSEGERYADEYGFKITYYSTSESSDESQTAVQKRIASSSSSKKYKVKFDANGGYFKWDTTSKIHGETMGVISDAYRMGFDFLGWYYKRTGDSRVLPSDVFLKDKNITIYAHWEPHKYNIKFNKNGGSGSMASMKGLECGKRYTLKANKFKRKGYTFVGWSKSKKGTLAYTNKAKFHNATTSDGKTVVLYAVWQKKTGTIQYNIKYKPNGGKGSMSSQKNLTSDKIYKLKRNRFKRKGYCFVGWSTKEGSNVKYRDSEPIRNLTTKNKKTVNLHAVWVKNSNKKEIQKEKKNIPEVYGCIIGGCNGDSGYTKNAARDVYKIIKKNKIPGYITKSKNIKLYTIQAEAPYRNQIKKYISKAFSKTTDNDISIVYYAGHGYSEAGSIEGSGITLRGNNYKDYYSYKSFLSLLNKNIKGRIILIVDTCFSGGFVEAVKSSPIKNRICVISSSGLVETSASFHPEVQNSKTKIGETLKMIKTGLYQYILGDETYQCFTYALKKGLNKHNNKYPADINRDHVVTCEELYAYIDSNIYIANNRTLDVKSMQSPECYLGKLKNQIIVGD